ncbi:MAG: tRNA lysidine(34) synthetase TilS [Acidobacteria bacterium]|nr:tRNA lysidine(34) synthetase TilS [Acidobacteriota bacterium]
MSKLAQKIERAIRRERLLAPGMKVAAGCSGGADSVALVRLLAELKGPLGIRLLVVHLNHQLRGADADADEGFVRRLAERLELEFLVRREDVAARARQRKINVEEAGRLARLEFFASLIAGGKADAVAVAHTLDDQAETVLARILRGAGTRGLAGIYPVVEERVSFGFAQDERRSSSKLVLVRPLLGVRRAELRDYLSEQEQAWREDATNLDRARLRNRLRLELLPQLSRVAGPAAIEHLARLADHARQEESFWSAYVEERFQTRARRSGDEWEVAVEGLLAPMLELARLPARQAAEAQRAVARRLLRRTLAAVRGDLRRITQTHVESVLSLAEEGRSGQSVDLPGVQVERRFDVLVFRAAGGRTPPPVAVDEEMEVAGPRRVRLPDGRGLEFKVIEVQGLKGGYNSRALDARRAPFPLAVRTWRPGDRYCPRGARRPEKLKLLFQQQRVSRRERARCPVVLSGGEIVWTLAFGPAAERELRPDSRRALVIEEWAAE